MLSVRLEEARTDKNMTKKEVAYYLSIDQSTYGKYELGKREPDYETVCKLADLFGVSVDWLLGRTMVKKPIDTIAAHHEGDEWTEEELEDIEKFKEFVRSRREREQNNK